MIRSATIVRTIFMACIMSCATQVAAPQHKDLKIHGYSVPVSVYQWLDAVDADDKDLLRAFVQHEKNYGAWPTQVNDFAIEKRYTRTLDFYFDRDLTMYAKLHPLRQAIRKGLYEAIKILAMHPNLDLKDGLAYAKKYKRELGRQRKQKHEPKNDFGIDQTIAILEEALREKQKNSTILDTCMIS